jgi:hypothetical protein
MLSMRELRTTSWWEWRIFEPRLRLPDSPDVALKVPEAPSTETWLLSPCSSFSVRVSEKHLEIKRLERIDRRGLELWRQIHRDRFPVNAADVATVCTELGIPRLELAGPVDLEQFLRSMRDAAPDVVVATIDAVRTPFQFAGCRGEHVVLTIGDRRWETVALAGQDPGVVHAALQRLGYSQIANVNYPAALKRMLGITDRAATP